MDSIGQRPVGRWVVAAALVLSLSGPAAQAQLNQLQGVLGGGHSGGGIAGLGGLPGGGPPSVTQASPSNTAGLLQFCIRNNYVDSGPAASVKNALSGRLSGSGGGTNDSGFQNGNKGLLQMGGGQTYRLGGSGVKAQVTHKLCDLVLRHAKSLL